MWDNSNPNSREQEGKQSAIPLAVGVPTKPKLNEYDLEKNYIMQFMHYAIWQDTNSKDNKVIL